MRLSYKLAPITIALSTLAQTYCDHCLLDPITGCALDKTQLQSENYYIFECKSHIVTSAPTMGKFWMLSVISSACQSVNHLKWQWICTIIYFIEINKSSLIFFTAWLRGYRHEIFFYLLVISQQNILNKSCRECVLRHLVFICFFIGLQILDLWMKNLFLRPICQSQYTC